MKRDTSNPAPYGPEYHPQGDPGFQGTAVKISQMSQPGQDGESSEYPAESPDGRRGSHRGPEGKGASRIDEKTVSPSTGRY